MELVMRMESKFGARALENKPFLADNEWKVVVKGSTLLLNEEDFIYLYMLLPLCLLLNQVI